MNKLNLTHEQDVVIVLSRTEYSVIQQALMERNSTLNNRHADIVFELQSDTLNEDEWNEKNHLLTMLEDELNTIKELLFYKS